MRKLYAILIGIVLLTSEHALSQTRQVTGTVTDSTGAPISGVSVQVVNSNAGTTTNERGMFTVSVPLNNPILRFTNVGFQTQQVNIGSNNNLNIVMTSGTTNPMQEVVVVAYGVQNRRKITGAVSTVNAPELENKPFPSLDALLQGNVPGLQSVSPNGQPGALQQIRIRGIGSITASSSPLFVVDGIPVVSGDPTRITTSSNVLAGINPNDIESVSVLKDAASASIYGSQAANGVIIITTKKGRPGKSRIRIDGEYGFSNIAYFNDISKPLTRDQYFALTQEGLANAGATQAQTTAILNSLGFSNTANEDWVNLVTRNGKTQNINASISGGDAKTTFYSSVGFFNQSAVIIGSDFRRYSGTINLSHKASDKLSFGFKFNGSYNQQNTPSASSGFRNPVFTAYSLRPSQPAHNPDGSLNYDPAVFNQLYNPIAIVQYDKQNLNSYYVLGNFSIGYQFYRDLSFTSTFGVDVVDDEEFTYYNPFFGDARTVGGRIYNYYTRIGRWVSSNLFNYTHSFLQKDVSLDFKAGYEAQRTRQYNILAQGTGVPVTTSIPLPTPGSPTVSNGLKTDNSLVSLLSILQLNYKTKYSLSGSLRRDGSSRFAVNNKYGTFWSVGAAWNIDQESFMPFTNVINALKLRASYGTNGNQEIGNYTSIGSYTFGTNYNQLPGSAPNQVDNPDLTWEENKPFNVGIDAVLLNNRISFSVDYYNRKTTRLLLADPLPPTTGFTSRQANIGSMENKGIEIQFNATPVRSKNFTWDISFNIALNKNKILSLSNNADIVALPYLRRVGLDYQSIYTRLWAGVDPATGSPQWFTDSSRTVKTTDPGKATRSIIGSATPKGFGGFITTFTYQNFSLSAQFNYQYGNLVYDEWGFLTVSDGYFPNLNRIQKELNRWQKPGDITDIPKYVYGGSNNSNAESSRWYYKGDYIRLRDLTISYSLSKKVLSASKISSAKFYVRGNNLWTKAFDKNITFDPEQQINGTNDLTIMSQRTISVGLTLGF